MKTRLQITSIPEGEALPNVAVQVRTIESGAALLNLTTDADGWIEISRNGNLAPYYLYVPDAPGGAYWRSDETKVAGVISPPEIPTVLRLLGNGVVRGYGSELEVSLTGALTFTVGIGAANVQGYPFVTYTVPSTTIPRPEALTRIDRVIIRLFTDESATAPGAADLTVLVGTEGAGVTALTQTAEVWEIGLATITVPIAGAVTLTDERVFAGETIAISSVARVETASTTDTSGVALDGATVSLQLTRAVDYDITADVIGRQEETPEIPAVPGTLSLADTFGSSGTGNDNFDFTVNTRCPLGVDSSGNVYVADTGNNRVIKRDSGGTYASQLAATDVDGLCVDASDNLYITLNGDFLKKYTSALALQWTSAAIGSDPRGTLTTDGTEVYVPEGTQRVYVRLMSTGAAGSPTSFGSSGSTDGRFGASSPGGVAWDGTALYVTDAGNNRIQRFTQAGVYSAKWAVTGTPIGIAYDAITGYLLVACNSADEIRRYTTAGVLVDAYATTGPCGIAVGSDGTTWVSHYASDTITKWTLSAGTPSVPAATGYGQIAVEIDGVVGTYVGIGDRHGEVANAGTGSATGPDTITVRAFAKATAGTITLTDALLWAKARPRG